MKTDLTQAELKILQDLPNFSKYPYAGTPGQGHPDEERVLMILASRHWNQLSSSELDKLNGVFFLVKPPDRVLLLPAIAREVFRGPEPGNLLCVLWDSAKFALSPEDGAKHALVMRGLIDELDDRLRGPMYSVVLALLQQHTDADNFTIDRDDRSFWSYS